MRDFEAGASPAGVERVRLASSARDARAPPCARIREAVSSTAATSHSNGLLFAPHAVAWLGGARCGGRQRSSSERNALTIER